MSFKVATRVDALPNIARIPNVNVNHPISVFVQLTGAKVSKSFHRGARIRERGEPVVGSREQLKTEVHAAIE